MLNIIDKEYTVCKVIFGYGLNGQKLSSINMIQHIQILIGK